MVKLISVLICLVMTLTLLSSCGKGTSIPADTDELTAKEQKEPDISNNTDIDLQEDTHELTSSLPEEPGEPVTGYKWAVEPADIEGDIQPILNVMSKKLYSSSLSILTTDDGESLIGADGEIKTELPSSGYRHCGICHGITNHTYMVDVNTFEITEDLYGHGGGSCYPYLYDKDTGELYANGLGVFTPINDIDRAIVSITAKRALTEEEIEMDMYSTDFAYDFTNNYGVYIDGELVLSDFEMYSPYSCGVIALCRDGKWGYYNENGEEIFPCEYDASYITHYNAESKLVNTPYPATYGILVLNKNGKWGFADTNGNMLTDFEFEEARPVFENKAWVKTAKGWGVIELTHNYTENVELNVDDNDSLYSFSL